ncbi:SDR family oxidoreductase [Halococcoides cellulosivorans]|uniref:Short-chain dehydrogenase n=1 Tax=Halococcoides cellulosivorans TaxID=1679096 RepID=A0A2R4X1N7_9EURY|nr:SDR family oxidoreductase [Halococcoides cellulosivorans]AWB27695.1 short-chain dehydrogenase [Halococcoides cellulosivorans]
MSTALVTGAASGIGRAVTEQFDAEGWTVYATDVDTDGLDQLARRGCETHRLDVTDDSDIAAVVETITAAGGIDCLVNNAGYGQLGPLEDVPIDRMQAQFDVNYWGIVRCVKAVLPTMREQGHGTIVTIGSVQGRVTTPGWGTYAGSKHALEGMNDALRIEVADQGIDVVLVEPAWVASEWADRVVERLTGFDRTECYRDLYESLEHGALVEGGRFAVTPERVARTVVAAAQADAPDARYAVGLPARLVLLTRLVPDSIADRVQQHLVSRYSGGKR